MAIGEKPNRPRGLPSTGMNNPTRSRPPLVLFSTNGVEAALKLVHLDQQPQFDVLLLDYTGQGPAGPLQVGNIGCELLPVATECKGDIYQALARHLADHDELPEYVALIDDDVLISISAINQALHIARCMNLDSFSPALTPDSQFSYRWSLQRGHDMLNWVDWVEVMMPFYRGDLFMAGAPHYQGNTSSFGIDNFLMPTLQMLRNSQRTAVINAVWAAHIRPITSGKKVFKNGLTAGEEMRRMRQHCLSLIETQAPHMLRSEWQRRIFHRRHQRTVWQRLAFSLGRPLRRWLELSA